MGLRTIKNKIYDFIKNKMRFLFSEELLELKESNKKVKLLNKQLLSIEKENNKLCNNMLEYIKLNGYETSNLIPYGYSTMPSPMGYDGVESSEILVHKTIVIPELIIHETTYN